MALETNQQGYDVISSDNERISVKTITSTKHVKFNPNTFEHVDRVMILRLNVDDELGVSVEILLDKSAADFAEEYGSANGNLVFNVPTTLRPKLDLEQLRVSAEQNWQGVTVRQFENGTIQVLKDGQVQQSAKPSLRVLAGKLGVDLLNGSSNPKNTRQLGADVLGVLKERQASH
ncbi:MAG: DUF6998 domain-containing protein [Cognatishimia sp.]